MTARVIVLDEHRPARQVAADTPVDAIRGFLNNAVYCGVSETDVSLTVPLATLERLMAVTLPEAQP